MELCTSINVFDEAMDWKDMLASKVEDGTLEREEFSETATAERSKTQDILHVTTDRKGRKGKTATIIDGFTVSDKEVSSIAAHLKTKLGVGGSSRGGEILIQGECADKVRALLMQMGYKVK